MIGQLSEILIASQSQRVLKSTNGSTSKLTNSTPEGTETKQAKTSEESVQGVRNPSINDVERELRSSHINYPTSHKVLVSIIYQPKIIDRTIDSIRTQI